MPKADTLLGSTGTTRSLRRLPPILPSGPVYAFTSLLRVKALLSFRPGTTASFTRHRSSGEHRDTLKWDRFSSRDVVPSSDESSPSTMFTRPKCVRACRGRAISSSASSDEQGHTSVS